MWSPGSLCRSSRGSLPRGEGAAARDICARSPSRARTGRTRSFDQRRGGGARLACSFSRCCSRAPGLADRRALPGAVRFSRRLPEPFAAMSGVTVEPAELNFRCAISRWSSRAGLALVAFERAEGRGGGRAEAGKAQLVVPRVRERERARGEGREGGRRGGEEKRGGVARS